MAFSSRSRRLSAPRSPRSMPVEGRVLRDQQQLAHAARRERARFAHDRFRAAASILAAKRRDDAERAGVVAAFGNLARTRSGSASSGGAACRRRRCRWGVTAAGCWLLAARGSVVGSLSAGADSLASFDRASEQGHGRDRSTSAIPNREPRTASLDRLKNLRHFSRAEHRIDLGNLLLQLVAIAFREAAGDHQARAVAVLLVLRHFEDGVD